MKAIETFFVVLFILVGHWIAISLTASVIDFPAVYCQIAIYSKIYELHNLVCGYFMNVFKPCNTITLCNDDDTNKDMSYQKQSRFFFNSIHPYPFFDWFAMELAKTRLCQTLDLYACLSCGSTQSNHNNWDQSLHILCLAFFTGNRKVCDQFDWGSAIPRRRLRRTAVMSSKTSFRSSVKLGMFRLGRWCHRSRRSWCGDCGGTAAVQGYLVQTFRYGGA